MVTAEMILKLTDRESIPLRTISYIGSEVHGSTDVKYHVFIDPARYTKTAARALSRGGSGCQRGVGDEMLIYQGTSAADVTNCRLTIDHTDFLTLDAIAKRSTCYTTILSFRIGLRKYK